MTIRNLFLILILPIFFGCKSSSNSGLSSTDNLESNQCRVLVAMSDSNRLTTKSIVPFSQRTKIFEFGFLLNEMAIPVKKLVESGCAMTFATPNGKEPIQDPQGANAIFFTDGLPNPSSSDSFLSAATAKIRFDRLIPTRAVSYTHLTLPTTPYV